ncbi:MAG: hypothetical protein ACYDA4_03225 [Ignavibacteriaceae bacterium]
MEKKFKYGPWIIEFSADDGARLDRILYNNYDLVSTKPNHFRKPNSDYGEYENRPVYGYDDCFPSVKECFFPGREWKIPDHGEVCWLNWDFIKGDDRLTFYTISKVIPARLKREMIFTDSSITWNFEVYNEGNEELPFQHVMHPLMKLTEISTVHFPGFQSAYNKTTEQNLKLKNPDEIHDYLITQPKGTANMLFLRKIKGGQMSWTYKNGLLLKVIFPKKYFPTIGIWWNNIGYPDENGIRRDECAFEPTPGFTSDLSEAYNEGRCLTVLPKDRFVWQIIWELYR